MADMDLKTAVNHPVSKLSGAGLGLYIIWQILTNVQTDVKATQDMLHDHVSATQSILDVQRTLVNVEIQKCINDAKGNQKQIVGCFSALTRRPQPEDQ